MFNIEKVNEKHYMLDIEGSLSCLLLDEPSANFCLYVH